MEPHDNPMDFAIITALEKEAKAIIACLENHHIDRFEDQDIRTYHLGTITIQGRGQAYRVTVVLLPSMGNVSAANAVTDTIVRWKPRFLIMLGIAGGIPQDDLDLGDVVVADQVVGYEYGKITNQGLKPRDRVYPASAMLLDRVRNFWDETWSESISVKRPSNASRPKSKAFVGLIASGNKVIASTEFRQQLLVHWPKLVAVEMESEGVFAAAFDRPQIVPTLVVRGICDMADERKSDEWQEYAAGVAASFTIGFLRSGPVEPHKHEEETTLEAHVDLRPSTEQTRAIADPLGSIYNVLRQTLMDCGPFSTNQTLKAVFAYPSLKPWQSSLPQADSIAERVDRLLDYLLDERNSNHERVIAIFLRVLSERIDPAIECHHRLVDMANAIDITP